jgi:hypothetical protein
MRGDKVLVSLVGSDPATTLLPARFLDLDGNTLIHAPDMKDVARCLAKLLPGSSLLEIDSRDLQKSFLQVIAFLDPFADYQFNLSDGPLNLAIISTLIWDYFETPLHILNREDGGDSLYTYLIEDGKIQPPEAKPLPGLLTLKEYLQVGAGEYTQIDPTVDLTVERSKVRESILSFLKILRRTAAADEDLIGVLLAGPSGDITLDLMLRVNNQIGAVIFGSKSADLSRAVNQLIAVGQETCLGPQTNRFLIVDKAPISNQLFSIAEAHRISILTPNRSRSSNLQKDEGIQHVVSRIVSTM